MFLSQDALLGQRRGRICWGATVVLTKRDRGALGGMRHEKARARSMRVRFGSGANRAKDWGEIHIFGGKGCGKVSGKRAQVHVRK